MNDQYASVWAIDERDFPDDDTAVEQMNDRIHSSGSCLTIRSPDHL